jgi:hypothetical protein
LTVLDSRSIGTCADYAAFAACIDCSNRLK